MLRTLLAALARASFPAILVGSLTAHAAVPALVRDVNATVVQASSNPSPLTVLNGKMLFGASDGTGPGLWITDGSSAGTQLLERFADKPGSYGYADQFATVGNRVYFSANDGTRGAELWVTDGTPEGTAMVADLYATQNFGSAPQFRAVLGSKVLLAAYVGNFNAKQLYVTDGTASGTQALTGIPAPAQGVRDSVFVTGTKAYFAVQDATGNKMMVTDGTPSGTHETSNPYGSSDPAQALGEDPKSFQQLGGRVLYASRYQLWSIDVATDTVTSVTSAQVLDNKLLAMNGYVLFLSPNSVSQTLELWRSDGTGAGTSKVATVDVTPNYFLALIFEKLGDRVVFRGNDGTGAQLSEATRAT
jgi:ELWxxDGT repeat protein